MVLNTVHHHRPSSWWAPNSATPCCVPMVWQLSTHSAMLRCCSFSHSWFRCTKHALLPLAHSLHLTLNVTFLFSGPQVRTQPRLCACHNAHPACVPQPPSHRPRLLLATQGDTERERGIEREGQRERERETERELWVRPLSSSRVLNNTPSSKAEMHLPIIAERYGLMLESYLRGAGTHRKELLTQVKVMDLLIDVALKVGSGVV
jgi:hypothetical protein